MTLRLPRLKTSVSNRVARLWPPEDHVGGKEGSYSLKRGSAEAVRLNASFVSLVLLYPHTRWQLFGSRSGHQGDHISKLCVWPLAAQMHLGRSHLWTLDPYIHRWNFSNWESQQNGFFSFTCLVRSKRKELLEILALLFRKSLNSLAWTNLETNLTLLHLCDPIPNPMG